LLGWWWGCGWATWAELGCGQEGGEREEEMGCGPGEREEGFSPFFLVFFSFSFQIQIFNSVLNFV
jgi:hypothetical protein